MGGVCACCPWICRPMWPLLIILAAAPRVMDCSESPAAAAAKVYPRGNQWAVGHLMGKKSLTEQQQMSHGRDDLSPSGTAGVIEGLMEAQVQHKTQEQMKLQIADKLLWLNSGWREEDRDKHLREISDRLLLAFTLGGDDDET